MLVGVGYGGLQGEGWGIVHCAALGSCGGHDFGVGCVMGLGVMRSIDSIKAVLIDRMARYWTPSVRQERTESSRIWPKLN